MINDPVVVAEITALHEQYEAALVSNNVEKLQAFFWDSRLALRFGVSEKVAMGMSGHRTRSVFNRYFIVDRAELDAAVKKLEAGRNESLSRLEAEAGKRSLAAECRGLYPKLAPCRPEWTPGLSPSNP